MVSAGFVGAAETSAFLAASDDTPNCCASQFAASLIALLVGHVLQLHGFTRHIVGFLCIR